MNINCMLADDEDLALEMLEQMLLPFPGVTVTGKFSSAGAALPRIEAEKPDLLILDIRMPGMSGLSLVRALSYRPAVILATAYSEFAQDAFELDAVDYVMKPYHPERFSRAMHKAIDFISWRKNAHTATAAADAFFYVKHNGLHERVAFDDILFIEGQKQYVRIVTADRKYMTLAALKDMEKQLPGHFRRVHKSFIVNMNRAQKYAGGVLRISDYSIPVGRLYRGLFRGEV